MFQRVGAVAYKRDLHNTIALCEALDNPQHKFKSIHVGGTNGKGSSSHMIASILQSAGYKTGLYTSPHLKEFTERIRINGEEVTQDFVVEFVQKIKPQIETIKPSFFEITVAMAFDYFAKEQVDFAVIEVGLGGRLDSTNVINPLVSLITNIGFDHKDLLGDTLTAIAKEKAGIIKTNSKTVISERQREIENVFIEKANEVNSSIQFAQDLYKVDWKDRNASTFEVKRLGKVVFEEMESELLGEYQRKNIPGVLCVIDELRALSFRLSDKIVLDGIAHTVSQTGLKGRWQKLGTNPLVFCDTAHNEDGLKEVLATIQQQTFRRLLIVFGVVKDKDLSAVLPLLPKDAYYYFCEAKIPRAMEAAQLGEMAMEAGLNGVVIGDVNQAIAQAKADAEPSDMIFIGGSTFVVAEISDL